MESDIVNYRHPDPARRAGRQKPGRYVTSQVSTESQDKVGCIYTPSHPGSPYPHETLGVSTCPAASLPCWWFRGEARTRSRCRQVPRPRRSLPAAPIRPSSRPSSRDSAGLTGRRRLNQTEGLWLRKSRPGTSGPARLPAAPGPTSSQA